MANTHSETKDQARKVSVPRGLGQLSVAQQQAALGMLRDGMSQQRVADGFGVTKNTVAGLWHRQGEPEVLYEPSTLFERCDALHARLDAVLAKTAVGGKLTEEDVKARKLPAKRFGK